MKKILTILVLEDSEERLKFFNKFFIVNNDFIFEVDYTFDVHQAIKYCEEKKYDLMFLDHDLVPEHYTGQYDAYPTGYDFVREFNKLSSNRNTIAFCMSLNPVGRKRMFDELKVKKVEYPSVWRDLEKIFSRDSVVRSLLKCDTDVNG